MKIAITGTLSIPRNKAIELIESRTNATFSEHVTYDTNYLVAARFDTNKAHRAAEIGVSVISERDMMEFVNEGAFPENRLPDRPKYPHVSRFPDIIWAETYDPEQVVLLEYQDADGIVSLRYVAITCRGTGSNGMEYIGGYDAERFKCFRLDRIMSEKRITRVTK